MYTYNVKPTAIVKHQFAVNSETQA